MFSAEILNKLNLLKIRETHLKFYENQRKEKLQVWLSHQLSKVVKWPGSFTCSDLISFAFISSFIKEVAVITSKNKVKEGKLSSCLEVQFGKRMFSPKVPLET